MEATIKDDGEVWVEDHKIGRLTGLLFELDESQSDLEAKAMREAAETAVAPEINRRLTSIVGGTHAIFTLSEKGEVLWGGAPIGKIGIGGTLQNPDVKLVGADLGQENLKDMAEERMRDFLRAEVREKLAPLTALKDLNANLDVDAEVRGFAYTLYENFGHLNRSQHGRLVNDLSQNGRKPFRELGVTFGQYDVFMREMIRPKPASLLGNLLSFGAGGDGKPFIPFAGVTSLANEGDLAADNFSEDAIYRAGYRACGPRIVRFDILNRLAGLIRQAQRESGTRRFQIMQEMLALLGCAYDEMRGVLENLGYQSQTIDGEEKDEMRPELSAPVPDRFIDTPKGRKSKPQNQAEKAPSEEKPNDETTSDETPPNETPAEAATAAPVALETGAETPQVETTEPAAEPVPAAEAPKPEPKKQKSGPKPLSVYNFRTTHDDGSITEEINKEFWFMPFKGKRTRDDSRQDGGHHRKGRPRQPYQQQGFKKGKPQKQKSGGGKPQNYGKKESRKVEDSPFAALAALKKDLSKDKS